MQRRALLGSACATIAGTAGCSGLFTSAGVEGEIRPYEEKANVPTPRQCDSEGVDRVRRAYDNDVMWGDADGFALRVDDTAYTYGETAKVTLTNARSERNSTGSDLRFAIEVFTDNGWQDVRVTTKDEGLVYPEPEKNHSAGEGFEWELTLTEEGLRMPESFEDIVTVCPELEPGRYRFVYWALENPVAVAFDLERSE